jgi:hypothetical protein
MLTLSVIIVAIFSRPTPPRLLLTAVAPRQVVLGDTWEMRLLVQSDRRSPLRLRLDRRLLHAFQLVGLTPLPLQVNRYGDWYEFLLPTRSEPQPVVVRFKSVQLGDYFMRAVVLNTRTQAEWRGRVRVVKTVPPRQPPKPLGVLAMALRR